MAFVELRYFWINLQQLFELGASQLPRFPFVYVVWLTRVICPSGLLRSVEYELHRLQHVHDGRFVGSA